MTDLNARQWQRFAYHADVQLAWREAEASAAHEQRARCQNLSRGGMQLRGDAAPPPIGASVACELAWAGRRTRLPGFVRWQGTASETHGQGADFGVEFGQLTAAQQQAVAQLLHGAEHGGERVQLRAADPREPASAYALPDGSDVRLRVTLPWLEPGSPIEFDLGDPPLRFVGQVVSTEPRVGETLQLEVRVRAASVGRARRHAIYQESAPSVPRENGYALTPAPNRWPPSAAGEPPLRVPKHNPMRAALGLVATAALFAGIASWSHARRARSLNEAARNETRRVTERAQPTPASEPLPAAIVQREETAAIASVRALAAAPTTTTTTTEAPPEAAASLGAPSTASLDTNPRAVPAATGSSTGPSPSATAQAASAGEIAEPRLHVSGDTSEVFIPVMGSLDGLRESVWSDPLAFVVELPQAQVRLAHSRYTLRGGGIDRLSVGRSSAGVTQVRLLLNTLVADYHTRPVRDGIEIRLTRDLRPLR